LRATLSDPHDSVLIARFASGAARSSGARKKGGIERRGARSFPHEVISAAAGLPQQRFYFNRPGATERQGECALHFACSGEGALGQLAKGIEPQFIMILSDITKGGWNFCQPCSPLRLNKRSNSRWNH